MFQTKKLVIILSIILIILLACAWYVFKNRTLVPLYDSNANNTVAQKIEINNATENKKSTKHKEKKPKHGVGKLPAAKYDPNAFTDKLLWGYNNPQALMTAVHKKTLNILSEGKNLNPHVLQLALRSYVCAHQQSIGKPRYITIIDYSLPSTDKRMWVIDLRKAKVDFHTLVAHGKNSGMVNTTKFSNTQSSKETSLGLFITKGTYTGHNGYSLKMDGLEPGFNDHAMQRNVVIHGASYVNEDFVKKYHRLGRGWGCPALSKTVATPVIDTIKEGTLVFSYYPSDDWLENSTFIHCSSDLPWRW